MFRVSKIILVLLLLLSSVFLMGMSVAPARGPAPFPNQEYMFYKADDFESGGDYKKGPKWWTFDSLDLSYEVTSQTENQHVLQVSGKASNWYVGGMGMYLGVDASRFTSLQMDIYGNGPNSGKLKIELIDDDNNNAQAEQDPKKGFAPIFDDKWSYTLDIDWQGWKKVSILFSDFKDENPGVGDDIWNPTQQNGSGGLIQMQFIVTATKKDGLANFKMDNIKFVKYVKAK
ncbi:MAG: hypothetical protein NT099_01630 [Candidatus Saganbacteria bacterium]|nr:hypothetical protein [Candidatus Saganbacteria bacterium]